MDTFHSPHLEDENYITVTEKMPNVSLCCISEQLKVLSKHTCIKTVLYIILQCVTAEVMHNFYYCSGSFKYLIQSIPNISEEDQRLLFVF